MTVFNYYIISLFTLRISSIISPTYLLIVINYVIEC